MARTIAQIKADIIAMKEADATLSGLTSTSNTAIWRLWIYITAVCINVLESFFDDHKAEVLALLAVQKPHTLKWYVTMAKLFQYGVALPVDSDVYPVPSTDPTVMVVTFASAVETVYGGYNVVRIKVATGTVGSLAALTSGQLTSFTAYMQLIKDAGVRLYLTSGAADNLQLHIDLFYDALVLDSTGAPLAGGSTTPVADAISAYLDGLPFNGLFVLNNCIGAILAVPGIVGCAVNLAQANHASLPYVDIPVYYTPDSGYMKLDSVDFLANVSYTAHEPIV